MEWGAGKNPGPGLSGHSFSFSELGGESGLEGNPAGRKGRTLSVTEHPALVSFLTLRLGALGEAPRGIGEHRGLPPTHCLKEAKVGNSGWRVSGGDAPAWVDAVGSGFLKGP